MIWQIDDEGDVLELAAKARVRELLVYGQLHEQGYDSLNEEAKHEEPKCYLAPVYFL